MMAAAQSEAVESTVFDWLCQRLIDRTTLGDKSSEGDEGRRALAVRGTVRLSLRKAGLGDQVQPEQMRIVIQKILPGELKARGLKDADQLCHALGAEIATRHFRVEGEEDQFGAFLQRTKL